MTFGISNQSICSPGGEFLVGLYRGRIVAIGGLQPAGGESAKIRRMRVHPEFQRRGFGQAILNRLESRAATLGFRKLVLDTSFLLKGALRFYPKNDYHKTDEQVRGNDRLIFFEKNLRPPA